MNRNDLHLGSCYAKPTVLLKTKLFAWEIVFLFKLRIKLISSDGKERDTERHREQSNFLIKNHFSAKAVGFG